MKNPIAVLFLSVFACVAFAQTPPVAPSANQGQKEQREKRRAEHDAEKEKKRAEHEAEKKKKKEERDAKRAERESQKKGGANIPKESPTK